MNNFLWPSDQDRADNEELDRVCVYAEQLLDNLERAFTVEPHLKNRADGVDGHYCIGRQTKQGYFEFWSKESKKWCSAGTVFKLGKQPKEPLEVGRDREALRWSK